MRGRETAGKGREGVSMYIKCNNQKKTNLLWEWARWPIPTLIVVAFSSPPGLPFVSSRLGPPVDVVEGGGCSILMLWMERDVTAGS